MSSLSFVHHAAADRAPQSSGALSVRTHDGVACCDAPAHRAERRRALHARSAAARGCRRSLGYDMACEDQR